MASGFDPHPRKENDLRELTPDVRVSVDNGDSILELVQVPAVQVRVVGERGGRVCRPADNVVSILGNLKPW